MVTSYDKIKFIFVYVDEAHAIDEWPVVSSRCSNNNTPVIVKQTHDLLSRIEAAKDFSKNYNFLPDMFVAPPEGAINFCIIYKPWPFKILGLNGLTIGFASEPENAEIRLDHLVNWMNS